MLEWGGKAVREDVLRAIARVGGWSLNNLNTVRNVYLKRVYDEFLDHMGLTMGVQWSVEERQAKLNRFLGREENTCTSELTCIFD